MARSVIGPLTSPFRVTAGPSITVHVKTARTCLAAGPNSDDAGL